MVTFAINIFLKRITIILLQLLLLGRTQAQPSRSPLSARYTGTGAYSLDFTDAFSGAVNQAALAEVKKACAGIYGERRFMLKELSNYSAALALPSKLGGFGLALYYFGGSQFNTSQVGAGYGKKLGDKIDIGIQFNFNGISIAGYGSSSTISAEAGTIIHLTEKLHIGLHVYNPAGGKFGKNGSEKLASVYSTGIGYEVSDKVFISTVIGKEEDQPVNINAGLEYRFADHFFSKTGVSTATGNYFFALGLQWKSIRIDAVNSWQNALGFTPGIMLLFNFHDDKPVTDLEK